MSVSEPARHHLYEAARTGDWDDQAAEALMSLLPSVGWADVATKSDLTALENSLRAELHREIGLLHREIGLVRGEIGLLRGDLGLVRGDLGHQTRTLLLSMAGLLVAGAGVALGTAALVT
jgi:hypothetical protein